MQSPLQNAMSFFPSTTSTGPVKLSAGATIVSRVRISPIANVWRVRTRRLKTVGEGGIGGLAGTDFHFFHFMVVEI